jgi:galactokinase
MELSLDDFYGTASLLPDPTVQKMFVNDQQWAACMAGAYPVLARHKNMTRRAHGANIACFSTVPTGGGAGSTAALSCATLAAITAAYHLLLEPLETAIMAQGIQHHVLGLPGGVSDAAISVLGKANQMLLFSGHTHEPRGLLPLPAGLLLTGIHIGPAGTAGPERGWNVRVAAAMAQVMIARLYKDLGVRKDPTTGCLVNVSRDLYYKYFRLILPKTIRGREFLEAYAPNMDRAAVVDPDATYAPLAAADYHVLENIRVQEFAEKMRAAAAAGAKDAAVSAVVAGNLMLEGHRAARDEVALGSPNAHELVDLIAERGPENGLYGARANGGTIAILAADSPSARQSLAEVAAAFEKKSGIAPRLLQGSSPGSAEIAPLKIALPDL